MFFLLKMLGVDLVICDFGTSVYKSTAFGIEKEKQLDLETILRWLRVILLIWYDENIIC